ncbi:DUF6414 family protein [Halorussus aquaticus]|uniref:Uncharacterized protein n=1 Tax=Halorussus aquaticus TaxID=2953748 RepID=A0ABD5Q9A0_9EURY|nr:hypothetical protein [Halorussus aquaticus]
MNLSGLRNYWRQWWFGQASGDPSSEDGHQFPQLREFVYIDQRSVRSLLASTDSGRVAAEQTNRESNVNTSKHNANAGAGARPVNVSAGTKRISKESTETENVYSFDLIQSKFTRLYEHEKIVPKISLAQDNTYDLQNSLGLSELNRGAVLEIRGIIRLHPLYRVYRAIEYINTAAPEESIIAQEDLQVIEESLGDKIPVEIEVDGLSLDDGGNIRRDSEGDTFNIVTLLDETELWTEPIQTLASSKQFRVFCRVEAVQSNWYPMKLVRVLESISDDLAEEYNTELEGRLQAAIDAFEASVEASSKTSEVDEQKVQNFVEFLVEKANTSVNDDQVDEVVDRAINAYSPEAIVAFEQEVELLKETYKAFTEVLSENFFSDNPSSLRSEFHQNQTSQPQSTDYSERDFTAHLEVNVIGIYW